MESIHNKENSIYQCKYQLKKENSKIYFSQKIKNKLFFNSVTGEKININIENEEDIYEIIPDLEQSASNNISQFVDICEKDKMFFNLWNSFIKSKERENKNINFENIIINFLKINIKELYKNNLMKNFIFHLVCVYDNNKINNNDLINIIDIMDNILGEYENNKYN